MEFDLIDLLRERCAVTRADVRLGIGDDAAILAMPAGHDLVACTDTLVAGVHFPLATHARDIRWIRNSTRLGTSRRLTHTAVHLAAAATASAESARLRPLPLKSTVPVRSRLPQS